MAARNASENHNYRKQTGRVSVELVAREKPNNRHFYAYDVLLNGKIIVCNSRDPEHDLARALRHSGIKSLFVCDVKTGKPRSLVNIEKAAKCCIGSNPERYKWKPAEASDSSPRAGDATPALMGRRAESFSGPGAVVGFPHKSATSPSIAGTEAP